MDESIFKLSAICVVVLPVFKVPHSVRAARGGRGEKRMERKIEKKKGCE